MQLIQSPNYLTYPEGRNKTFIFLAGGTAGPDWRETVTRALDLPEYKDIIVFNPVRSDWNLMDDTMYRKQVEWEARYLEMADLVTFWFSAGTLCPISLFEYGKMLAKHKDVILGVHPDYEKKKDLLFQSAITNPTIPIVHSLEDLITEIKFKITT